MEQKKTTVYKQGNDAAIAYSPVEVEITEVTVNNIICGSQATGLTSMERDFMSW